MTDLKRSRKEAWSCVGLWVFTIYSTLYVMPHIFAYFKAFLPLSPILNVLVICLLIAFVAFLKLNAGIRRPETYAGIVLAAFCYIYGLTLVRYIAEKVHFIEYGFLAYLIYQAFRLDCNRPLSYLYAGLLTSLFGLIDEGIQHILPGRYYEFSDVVLNAVSGALGLWLVFLYEYEKFSLRGRRI